MPDDIRIASLKDKVSKEEWQLRVDLAAKVSKNHDKIERTTTDVARIGGAKINAKWFREFLAHDSAADLARIRVPVLAVTGDKDLQTPPEDVHRIREIVGDRAEVRVLPGLTHTLRRTPEQIHGEVDWINYLAAGGATVARAERSARGELVEAIDDGKGGRFLATAFAYAPGRPPWEVGWTPARYEAYGRLIGRTHALTKEYAPADPAWRRDDWLESWTGQLVTLLPPGEEIDVQGPMLDAQLEMRARAPSGGEFSFTPRVRATYFPDEQDLDSTDYFADLYWLQQGQRLRTEIRLDGAQQDVVNSEQPDAEVPGDADLGDVDLGDSGRVLVDNRRTRGSL